MMMMMMMISTTMTLNHCPCHFHPFHIFPIMCCFPPPIQQLASSSKMIQMSLTVLSPITKLQLNDMQPVTTTQQHWLPLVSPLPLHPSQTMTHYSPSPALLQIEQQLCHSLKEDFCGGKLDNDELIAPQPSPR